MDNQKAGPLRYVWYCACCGVWCRTEIQALEWSTEIHMRMLQQAIHLLKPQAASHKQKVPESDGAGTSADAERHERGRELMVPPKGQEPAIAGGAAGGAAGAGAVGVPALGISALLPPPAPIVPLMHESKEQRVGRIYSLQCSRPEPANGEQQ